VQWCGSKIENHSHAFTESLLLNFPLQLTCCDEKCGNISTTWDQAKPPAANYNFMLQRRLLI